MRTKRIPKNVERLVMLSSVCYIYLQQQANANLNFLMVHCSKCTDNLSQMSILLDTQDNLQDFLNNISIIYKKLVNEQTSFFPSVVTV